jgi:hypothetical protein
MRSIAFLLLLLTFFSHGQEVLNGKIVESSSGNVIPFATIGLLRQNTGTNANEKGEFTIKCQHPGVDSLLISCIGYVTIRTSVSDFMKNPVVQLSLNVKRLRPVVVKNKWTSVEVGTSRKYLAHGLTTTGYESQAATRLTAPIENTFLQSLHIRTSKYGGASVFRVHVFDFDSVSKGPGEELTDTLIQVSSQPGITTIDMRPYQIWIPGKDFFVSVEWLCIPSNAQQRATGEGKDPEPTLYNPLICFTKEPQSGPEDIWGLAYSGKWHLMSDKKYFPNSLAISAILKY